MSSLLILILIPVVGSLFIIAGSSAKKTALWAAALNFLGSLYLLYQYNTESGGYQFYHKWAVVPPLGINLTLGVDGLGLAMVLLSTTITLAAIAVARVPVKSPNWFFTNLLLISAGCVGAFASVDVFFFYMFHELALIPTFILIGVWGSGDRQTAAWKITTYLAFGSFVLLIGLISLYLSMPENLRTFDMQQIAQYAQAKQLSLTWQTYLLIVLGFGILVSLFPFHTWAPQAYASAPSPATMLHAGVLKKFGLYGILRLVTPVFPPSVTEPLNDLLLVLLLGNVFYCGYVTVAQRKLDLMLGYTSVMHMGYIFLGLLTVNSLGIAGASFMMVAHGLSVGVLFALSGELRERTHTLDFADLGGLARTMPAFGLLFGFAAMASVGLPGFANFVGELTIFFSGFRAGNHSLTNFNFFQVATVLSVWGVVISAIFMLRAYRRIFMGPPLEKWKTLPDLGLVARLCIAGLIVLLLLFGFFPQLVFNYVAPALIRP